MTTQPLSQSQIHIFPDGDDCLAHVDSDDCECTPVQDSEDPHVWNHNPMPNTPQPATPQEVLERNQKIIVASVMSDHQPTWEETFDDSMKAAQDAIDMAQRVIELETENKTLKEEVNILGEEIVSFDPYITKPVYPEVSNG